MKWRKGGLIFAPDGSIPWMQTHASIPIVDRLDNDSLRIYFGTRDAAGKSHIGYVDTRSDDPSKIIGISREPVLLLGDPGTFDDSGTMPSWILDNNGKKFLYYIGWNPEVTVSYRLSIGLALSRDGGKTFTKYSQGPICDRAIDEPFFNTAPCVHVENGLWRMWYISCTGWEVVAGRTEPRYHVKYAESPDGTHWQKTGRICIDYDSFARAIGRPCVFRENGLYRMLYSYRNTNGYRTDPQQSYRLGYAESTDGLSWERIDERVGIERADQGWDSEMMEYCSVYLINGSQYLFYNGNGFGASGFGFAVREK